MKLGIRPHPVFLAILLMAICLIPIMALKDISPANELRYLSIADEAIENGSVFTFSNQGEPYADKPPFYLWLLMLSRLVFGEHNYFILCLFSFIPAMITVGVMDKWLMLVSRLSSLKFSDLERFAAAMMLGTSAMFLGTAVILRMDMLMTMFIVLSLYTFYKLYKDVGSKTAGRILLPVYIFMALFTKGPVGIIMPVFAILFFLLFSGKIRDVGKYLGWRTWSVIALLCVLWFTAVWLEGGKAYLDNLLFHQTVDRAVDAFHHKEPFWYYFIAIWYVAAPYSIAMIYSMFSKQGRHGYVTDAGRLFFTAFAVTFVMLSMFSSKLSVYLLPVVPFMAYFTVIAGKDTGCNGWMKFSLSVPSAIFALLALAVFASPALLKLVPGLEIPEAFADMLKTVPVYAAAVILLAGAVLAFISLFARRSWAGAVSFLSSSLLLAILALSPLVPRMNDYIGYRNLAAVAKELEEITPASGYATLYVNRPENMDVFFGQDIVSFGNDVSSMLDARISDTILIVKTAPAAADPSASSYLSGRYGVEVGDYTVYVIR